MKTAMKYICLALLSVACVWSMSGCGSASVQDAIRNANGNEAAIHHNAEQPSDKDEASGKGNKGSAGGNDSVSEAGTSKTGSGSASSDNQQQGATEQEQQGAGQKPGMDDNRQPGTEAKASAANGSGTTDGGNNNNGAAAVDGGRSGVNTADQQKAASGEAAPQPAKPASTNSVTFSIQGDKKHGSIFEAAEVELEKGDTALDLLLRVTRKHKIQAEFRGKGPTAYVEGIDNLYEFDNGPESGWIFKINGETVMKSAGMVEPQIGDVVEWVYSKEDSSGDSDS